MRLGMDPAIQAALALSRPRPDPEADATLAAARAALRTVLDRNDLAGLLRGLEAEPLDRDGADAATDLALTVRLLSRAARPLPDPVVSPAEAEALAAHLRRACRVTRVPQFAGVPPRPYAESMRFHRRGLEALGGEWVALRTYAHVPLQDHEGQVARDGDGTTLADLRLALTNPGGVAFEDPLADIPAAIEAFRPRARPRFAPPDLSLRIRSQPVPGDLDLAMSLFHWHRTHQGVLEVEGPDGRVRLLFEGPAPMTRSVGSKTPRVGVRLRVPASLLPSEPRLLRIRAVGLQAASIPPGHVGVEEIFQRIGPRP